MKSMTVRLEDDFYKEIKHYLVEQNKSFNEYVNELIKKDLNEKSSLSESEKGNP